MINNINNFDATNKLSAYDLLYLIAIHIDSLDINILSEQLLDMQMEIAHREG